MTLAGKGCRIGASILRLDLAGGILEAADLVQQCSILEQQLQKWLWINGAGRNGLTYRWTFCIQGRGRCVVYGEGEQISRLRRYRALIPDDGNIAVRFAHALCG